MAKQPLSDRIMDQRVVDRYVLRGELTDKDLAKHLKSLPDLTDASEALNIEESAAEGNSEVREA